MSRYRFANLAEMYRRSAENYGDRPAFATKDREGVFQPVTYRDLFERGLALATALIELGLEQGGHVGLLADNRFEWILCDFGILLAGGADVPRGTDITDAEVAYIMGHADVRFIFVEHRNMFEKLQRVRADLPAVHTVILMDPKAEAPPGVLKLEALVTRGRDLRAQGDRRAEERMAAIKPDDLFTIIYTSGTTGTPKGVQLTHAAMASQIRNLPFGLKEDDCALAILPIWHSYERVFETIAISRGLCTYYTSLRAIADDLKTVRPTIMVSAPRLWESLYQKLMARIDAAPPPRRMLFRWARHSTSAVRRAERFFKGQQLDLHGRSLAESFFLAIGHAARWILFQIPHRILDKIVLQKLREAVGCGRFRGTISGGGALQPHVDEFFNFIGIPVLEGYGLTETCPVLAVRTWDNLVIGTVGPIFPETEIRIVDLQLGTTLYPDPAIKGNGRGLRGEIHVRGPQTMKGYYKNPAGTAQVLRDGWLNTGDIGMITYNNCLKILGRSKDTIVLLNGENVEPSPIESKLTQSPLIEHCMVVGQDQKHLGALVVPSLEGFRSAGICAQTLAELAANPAAREAIEREVRLLVNAAQGFKPFELIKDFRLVPKPFETGQELTATLKLRRHVLIDLYGDLIAAMYPQET